MFFLEKDEKEATRQNTILSKAALEMLHTRFSHSAWAARIKFYY
jgi:hypothetical protein